jgi:hypothetical protein
MRILRTPVDRAGVTSKSHTPENINGEKGGGVVKNLLTDHNMIYIMRF